MWLRLLGGSQGEKCSYTYASPGTAQRFEAIEKLRALSGGKQFKAKKIELDGFILASATTSLDNIPGTKGSVKR
jgi:hypothetical protein